MSVAGYLEIFTVGCIAGWAWDPNKPDEPVDVVVQSGDETIFSLRADRFRGDLLEHGIGNGLHGFKLTDLHSAAPWTLSDLTVRRASDGVELEGASGMLLATDGPHLLLTPGHADWFVTWGSNTYRLLGGATELTSILPLSIQAPGDTDLTVSGEAEARLDSAEPALLLQRHGEETPRCLPLGTHLPSPTFRWCRGAPASDCWVKSEVAFEVGSAIGLEFTCFLPLNSEAPPKSLLVSGCGDQDMTFELARNAHTLVAFRLPHAGRHRIRMATEPEPNTDRDQGFLLHRLDALWPPFIGADD